MALLFCDGFDDGLTALKWTLVNGTAITTSGRTGANRLAFAQGNEAYHSIVPTTTVIVGHAFVVGSTTALFVGNRMPAVYGDLGTVEHIGLSVNTDGTIILRRGGTQIADSGAKKLLLNVWYYIELKTTIADAGGTAEVHVNGESWITFTGDTRNGGTSALIDRIGFIRTGNSGSSFWVDDFYVCDGTGAANNNFLGDIKVETLYPNGNGNSSQLVGSDGNSTDNYLLVDEAGTPVTTDYTASATVGNKDTYTFSNLAAAAGPIKGVQVVGYASKSDAGARTAAMVTRSGTTEADGASTALTNGSFAPVYDVRETNPDTGSAWTVGDVNGAEFGIKVSS